MRAEKEAEGGDRRSRAFGRWYRERPFVGGVLTVFGGVEMFFSGQLSVGAMRVQVGIEGFQATVIPIVLVLVGVLATLMPQHRVFYGVIGLVVAVYSLVGVNLGGFFVGMILASVGGVMVVSWMPRRGPKDGETPGEGSVPGDGRSGSRRRATGGALVVALTVATTLGITAAQPQRAAAAEATGVCVLGFVGDCAGSTPAPTGATTPDTSTPGVPMPGAPALPTAPVESAAPGTPQSAGPVLVAPPSASPVFSGKPALLQGSSLSFSGLRYVGLATVRLSGGRTATVLKLAMDSVTIPGFRLDTRDANGAGTDTVATQMAFSGGVDTYCSSLTGVLENGAAVRYDVQHPPSSDGSVPAARILTIEVFGITGGSSVLTGFHEMIS
jgi:hypothetical protein